jgi:ABC-type proline/glycine betaine transport system substrate-binding protein
MALRHRQRGWVGLVVILLALVIVALVAKTALKQYGLVDDPSKAQRATAARATEAEQAATVTPRNALERARGVEDMVKQGAAEQQKTIDDAISK